MWFERAIGQKLLRLAQTYPAIVLTGARQTGKTSLLKRLFPNHSFVSLDLPGNAQMAETRPEDFLVQYPPPVVIDEVQYAPKLFRYLKVRIDEQRDTYGNFILTGSQKFALMHSISDSLAGRIAVVELETLSVGEILTQRNANLSELLLRGGFPELQSRLELRTEEYFSSYLATYLERDVRSISNISSLRDFERFIRASALRSGRLLNKSDLARDIGVSAPTANDWLSILEASNQLLLLEPWFSNKTKSIVKAPKLYLADTGLLCFLLGIRDIKGLLASPLIGEIWETFVFSELRKFLAINNPQAEIWLWRDRKGLEIDFLIHSGGRFKLFETKWSEHPAEKDAANLQAVSEILGSENVTSCYVISRTPARYTLTLNANFKAEVISLRNLADIEW